MGVPKTMAEVEAHNARVAAGKKSPGAVALNTQTANAAPGVERERDLHDRIEADLKSRRWYYVHSRTDKKTTQAKGVPDFIIAAPGVPAKTLWIEIKKKGGKLSPEQNITRHILCALNHYYFTVYSWDDFLTAIIAAGL